MSVGPCVHLIKLLNMNIFETIGPIEIKFYLKHYWFRGKAALCFGRVWIRTLVSMATDSF